MPSLSMRFRSACLSLALLLPLWSGTAAALDSLDDGEMAQVSGAGIALAFDDFQFAMAPSSYFEQVGSVPGAGLGCTTTGQTAGNYNCWRRGDLRWYGVNISGAGGSNDGYQWNDSTLCSSSSLNCPRGGVVDNFSPFDNPYLIRSASPQGMAYDGGCVNGTAGGCTASTVTKAIYEFLAPSLQPNYTFSWWGETEVGSTRNSSTQTLATNAGSSAANVALGGGLLKSQNIIRGNAAGSVFRLFLLEQTGNKTFGMLYHSRLKGDFRFSVAQQAAGPGVSDAIGIPTLFADTEGLFFRNVNAFIPLGQLYYQALTVSPVGTSGNFALDLTPLPSATAPVYNLHYALNGGDTQGFETARMNNTGGATTAQYQLTHGFSRWGGWNTNGTVSGLNTLNGNDGSPTGDGIIFQACTGCGNFRAFASRPEIIDKRGSHFSMQRVQNYNCPTGNAATGCSTAAAGPVSSGDFTGTQANNCSAYGTTNHNCYTTTGTAAGVPTPAGDPSKTYSTNVVNLGDSRIEGLMFQSLRFESCGGVPAC